MTHSGSDFFRLQCEDAPSPLLSFKEHAFALSLLLRDGNFGSTLVNALGAGDWLGLAAGLNGVSIVTEGLDYQDVYCKNEYEETRGLIASGIATEWTRALFVWGALELMMPSAIAGKTSKESGPRQLSRLVGTASPSLVHHECIAKNLLAALENHGSKAYARGAAKARKFCAPLVAQGTFAAYQVRNILAHGAVEWPDDYEESMIRIARIGRLASRSLVFAVQQVMLQLIDSNAEIVDWCEESGGSRVRLIKELLPMVHLGVLQT